MHWFTIMLIYRIYFYKLGRSESQRCVHGRGEKRQTSIKKLQILFHQLIILLNTNISITLAVNIFIFKATHFLSSSKIFFFSF